MPVTDIVKGRQLPSAAEVMDSATIESLLSAVWIYENYVLGNRDEVVEIKADEGEKKFLVQIPEDDRANFERCFSDDDMTNAVGVVVSIRGDELDAFPVGHNSFRMYWDQMLPLQGNDAFDERRRYLQTR